LNCRWLKVKSPGSQQRDFMTAPERYYRAAESSANSRQRSAEPLRFVIN
jgi:hypothetical protein